MKPARVLIVDDSATMRSLIAAALASDPSIEVIGEAGDPLEARQAIKALNPDVVTLDIEMPNMNGLEFLDKIMRLRPTPVVMVSTLTKRGAEATLKALEIGAVDCVEKPSPGNDAAFSELPAKIKMAAAAKLRARAPELVPDPKANRHAGYRPDGRIIAIGSSTGGVEALITVLSSFPANCPPTVVAQHMPPSFTTTFASRLNRLCAPEVSEAKDGERLAVGKIYLAPGGLAHLEIAGEKTPRCRLRQAPRVNGHCPSVDVLFASVAKNCGADAVGIILTGMGSDGAAGLKLMRDAGARTFGQNEQTCVVYGMPKAAFELGAVERQLPLQRIGKEVIAETAVKGSSKEN